MTSTITIDDPELAKMFEEYGAPMAHGGAKTPSFAIRQEIDDAR